MKLIHRFYLMTLPPILLLAGGVTYFRWIEFEERVENVLLHSKAANLEAVSLYATDPTLLSYYDNFHYELEKEAEIDLETIRETFGKVMRISAEQGRQSDYIAYLSRNWSPLVVARGGDGTAAPVFAARDVYADFDKVFSQVSEDRHLVIKAVGEDADGNGRLDTDEAVGFIQAEYLLPREEILKNERSYLAYQIQVLAGFFFLLMTAVFWAGRSVTRPIARLSKQAQAVSSGQMDFAFSVGGDLQELQTLGGALNQMMDVIGEKQRELLASRNLLQEQLGFQQTLIDSINLPIYYKDRNGHYLGCNRAFEKMIGNERGKIIGKTLRGFLYSAIAERLIEEDQKLLSTGGSTTLEDRYPDPTGRNIDVLVNRATFLDNAGRVAGLIGAILDITEVKKAENELRANEEYLMALLKLADMDSASELELIDYMLVEGVRLTGSEGGYLRLVEGEGALHLYRQSGGEDCVRRFTGLSVNPSDLDNVWKQALETKKPVFKDTISTQENLSDGHPLSHQMAVPLVIDGRVLVVAGVCDKNERYRSSDARQLLLLLEGGWRIIMRKRAVEELQRHRGALEELVGERTAELRQSRWQLKTVIDTVSGVIFLKDLEGRHLLVNRSFEEAMGISREEALGKTAFEIFPRQVAEAICKTDQEIMASRESRTFEERVPGGDGIYRDYLTTKLPFLDDKGRVVGLVGLGTDITVQKKVEKELMKARREAEAANRAKSDFLANMSHEIRTPMNGVIGMTGLLLDTELTDEQREYGEMVRFSAETLLHVINDILDFSKVEAGRLELECTDFALRVVLEGVSETLGPGARQKGLEFTCLVDQNLPKWLRGDPGRLRQVLLNLAGNAVKFTEKGRVTIRASLEEEYESEVRISFEVKDTGIGISPAAQGRLFESFTQVDASTSRKYGGTGLGLAISRQLVELMGGSIALESIEGGGSTFFFTAVFEKGVPAAASDIDGTPPPKPISYKGARDKPRILLAEDNLVNSRLAVRLLEKNGYLVEVVGNGREAVEALSHSSFAAVLMDVQMPEMDGLEATVMIREGKAGALNQEVPIIALTAGAMVGDDEKCLASGMNDYVSKPLSVEKLLDALNRQLARD